MPCGDEGYYEENYEDEEALAERGLNPDEIADLQARAVLARETAKMESFEAGDSLTTQQGKIEAAVKAAVADWHKDQHAKLKYQLELIIALGKAHAPVEA